MEKHKDNDELNDEKDREHGNLTVQSSRKTLGGTLKRSNQSRRN